MSIVFRIFLYKSSGIGFTGGGAAHQYHGGRDHHCQHYHRPQPCHHHHNGGQAADKVVPAWAKAAARRLAKSAPVGV